MDNSKDGVEDAEPVAQEKSQMETISLGGKESEILGESKDDDENVGGFREDDAAAHSLGSGTASSQKAFSDDVEVPQKSAPALPSLMDNCEEDEEEDEDACSKSERILRRHSMEPRNAYENGDDGGKQDFDIGGLETPPHHIRQRRRHTIAATSSLQAPEAAAWSEFVRKGARLKTILDDALQKVANGFALRTPAKAGSKRPLSSIDGEEPIKESPRRRRIEDHTADIAREKTAEVIVLRTKLREAEAHAASMSATTKTLREAAAASASRMERTAEALRIAGTNAANARADADAAEANSAALSNQLQALKCVVDETKHATKVLYDEHEKVSAASRSLESRLLVKESENKTMKKENQRLLEAQNELKDDNSSLRKDRDTLDAKLTCMMQQLDKLTKSANEKEALEQARTDRSHQIEKELRETRALLIEATSATAETQCTLSLLNETIQELRKENKTLHEKIESVQDTARKERDRLSEALGDAESDTQNLRIKSATDKEERERLVLDKKAHEEHIAKLKTRISSLERHVKDATMVSPLETAGSTKTPLSEAKKSSTSFSIPKLGLSTPMLPATGKENRTALNSGVKPAGKCCLCNKDAFGLMKSCQCGKKTCDKRAHAMCITGMTSSAPPSVSHPGTPAPRLPVILCDNFQVSAQNKIHTAN